MNKTIKIPTQLAITFDEKRCAYYIRGGCFEFFLYFMQCPYTGAESLECFSVVIDGHDDFNICIPLNGKKRLSCDVVETLVIRELHKAFA